jgi:hypothetical protein
MKPKSNTNYGHDEGKMYELRGVISTLYISDGTVNLLTGMQSHMAAAGLGSAFADMAGSVANAAMISMYEGEAVQHFACYVDEQMVIGTFPEVGFKEGDKVSVVVSRLDEKVLFAHAVVRLSDARLWMPHSVEKGRFAFAIWLAKLMMALSLLASLFTVPLLYAYEIFGGFFATLAAYAVGMTSVSLLIALPTYLSSPESKYAERIMKVLGFRNPKMVNLSPYCERSLGIKSGTQGGAIQVYDLRAALVAYRSLDK